ncbi:MAG: MarR family transcriptional regulator [Crocinitomicaceae bacterium]|nr:MarR family transcriptional regulator [Crocinitomicaceae bacterium]MBK8924332.1 MarR family transcriptional regulator [Crocinitomicaceae bacterium]
MNREQLFEFYVRNNWFKISRYYNQVAAKYKMTFSWGFILINVEKEGTPSTSLGPKMGMEPTSLSRTLKSMEDRGLIYREPDKVDKRKSLVFLTEKGLEKRKIAREVVLEFNQKLYDMLPKSKVAAFFEVSTRIDELLNELLVENKENQK